MVALALSAFFIAAASFAVFALTFTWRAYAGQFMALRRELARESESTVYVIGEVGSLRPVRAGRSPVRARTGLAVPVRPAQRVAA